MSIIQYKAATHVVAGRPSPKIWADCPVVTFLKDPGKGFHFFDDFFEAPGATTVAGSRWYSYIDSAGSFALSDSEKGILTFVTDFDDDDITTIITGNNTTGLVTPANLSDKKWWFETRFAVDNVDNDGTSFFLGLTEEGQAANSKPATDDTGVINDIDHVGFRVAADDGNGLDFVWNLSGQTAQATESVQTLVAGTFYNVGFKYEPKDNKVHVFVDGVENVSAGFLMSHASAPADTLAVCLSNKIMAGATGTLSVDWVRMAVEY